MLTKLSYFNISLSSLKWMESYIAERKQCVRVDNVKSATCDNTVGVPQGSILGPLLFSLYINDLPTCCPPNVSCQMYADDAVLYVQAKNKCQAAQDLSAAIVHVSNWLQCSRLHLNAPKTVCMFFSKKGNNNILPDVFVNGNKLEAVGEFKYLGIIINSQLCFKQQVKRAVNQTKFNLSNFRYIRNNLTTESAKLYFSAMAMTHLTYCITIWALACKTTLKSAEIVYKQAIKILDKKTKAYHHCNILRKHGLLSWGNTIKHADGVLVYKILHGLAPPPLGEFIKTNPMRSTRAGSRGDCQVPLRKSVFGQTVFSYRATQTWNTIPNTIRYSPTLASFTGHFKTRLLENQICTDAS